MEKVAIIGVGQSAFVRGYPGSIRELTFEAYKEAMNDAKIQNSDIDATIICSAPEYDKQRSPAGVIIEYLGLTPQPTFYVETLCSSSSTGLRLAYSLIKSGLHNTVLILGFQKMSEITSTESQERMSRGADIQWESPFGTMMPAYYAMYAKAYIHKYKITEEDLGLIRIKAAIYGQLNEKAVYRKPIELQQYLSAELISSPLKVMDCCANADGSSCIIIANKQRVKDLKIKKPIWIIGIGAASAPINMANRISFTGLEVAQQAAKNAYKIAGINSKKINVAEVHDCFTIAEILAYEDLGFAEPGQAKELIHSKATYKDGFIPVNIDGGLLSKGHPIGATGGSQIRTIVLQLRNECELTQVKDPCIGLIHNIGGIGLYGNVTILERQN